MAAITIHNAARGWDDDGTYGMGSARWAFTAILVVMVIVMILGTIRVNRKRRQQGVQPLYGTRWMTPPSYGQSQTQYNQPKPDPDMNGPYVPTYTATANDTDMGYYDANGVFHANPNAKNSGIIPPQAAHQRQTSVSTGIPLGDLPRATVTDEHPHEETHEIDDDDDFDNMFRRHSTAPIPRNTPTHNFMLQNSDTNTPGSIPGTFPSPDLGVAYEGSSNYTRPSGPPPSASYAPPAGPPPEKSG